MQRVSAWLVVAFVSMLALPASAIASDDTTLDQAQDPALVRVLLRCGCDSAALKAKIAFVEFVDDPARAAVEVAVSSAAAASGNREWTLTFTGRNEFVDQNREVPFELAAAASEAEVEAEIVRRLKFGLAEYAVHSDAGAQLDVTVRAEPSEETTQAASLTDDPWDYWVFRLSANGFRFGETTASDASYSFGASASRTTEAWKIRLSGSKSRSTSEFDLGEGVIITTDQDDWSMDALVVRSLGPRWSAGMSARLSASTYSNQKQAARVSPAIEFDVFPYAESNQRSLTLQYAAGPARYEYLEATIYDKLDELRWQHSLTASLGLRQPWGTAGATAAFSQNLAATDQTRISLSGSVSVRLLKGFSVSASSSYSRIRDQFYLAKAGASDEEILLRLRQLATGFSYSSRVSLTYSFGSLSNATVNPRFGG